MTRKKSKPLENMNIDELRAFAATLVKIELRRPDGSMGVISIQRHMVGKFNLAFNEMLKQWHESGKYYHASNLRWK